MEEKRNNTFSLIGFALMFVVLIYYMYNQKPPQQTTESTNNTTQQSSSQQVATPASTTLPTDSLGLSKYKETLGAFGFSAVLPSAKDGAFTETANNLFKLPVCK